MKFKFKRTIEISLEEEMPLLGYDIKKAVQARYSEQLKEALQHSVDISESVGEYHDSEGKPFLITINDTIHSIE